MFTKASVKIELKQVIRGKSDHPVRVFRLEILCLNFKARQLMSLCVACWRLERKSRKQFFLLLFGNNWGLIFLGN